MCAQTTLVVVPKFSFEGMLKSIQRHKIRMLPYVPFVPIQCYFTLSRYRQGRASDSSFALQGKVFCMIHVGGTPNEPSM